MDNQPVKRLWDQNADYPELRRPKENTPTVAGNNVSDVVKYTTLSVEAKEWYPPGYMNSSTPANHSSSRNHSVQNRLTRYRQDNDNNRYAYDKEMEFLNDIIKTLTNKPGEFDDLIYVLMEFLEPHFTNIEVISRVTSAIFQQALNAPNFQYSGVRLFAVLDENCPLVRGYLHSLCEKELETTANLQSVLLFYAEIYSKLNFELFGKCLLKALHHLKPNADNVKSICQTLKLTGAKLEALDKPLISEIISQLDKLRTTLPSMSYLVESVIKLRDSRWGLEEVPAVTPPAEPYEWSDGPVFYGPDGMELTSEESEFLSENLNDFIIDDSDPDGLWNPEPEMNEEIQAAFAEFVASNTR